MIFQRRQKALCGKGLSRINLPTLISMTGPLPILGLLGGIFFYFFHILIKQIT